MRALVPLLALTGATIAHAETAGPPEPRPFSLTAGYSVWNGDFGAATKTLIWSALVGVRYQTGGLRLTAALPRMHIRSDGSFFAGLGGTPLFVAPNIASTKRIRNGWGDLTLGAAYSLPGEEQRGFGVELTGRVKLPTATDRSQLSTGKTDFSGGVELSKSYGRLTPMVSATYRVFGDAPGWKFRNGFYATAGAAYALTPKTAIVASYEYTQAATRFIGDAHEIVLGASTPVAGDRLRLTGYGSAGLSQGASDVSAGASLSLAL